MRWTTIVLVVVLLLAPALAEQTLDQEVTVQVNSLAAMNLTSIVISPEASVKVATLYFNISIENTGSNNLTNVSVYTEITDPSNNTADSYYSANYTVEPGETLVISRSWGNNDCPGGCSVGAYIISAVVYADTLSPQSANKTFTISNPPPLPPSPPPSGGGGGGAQPPVVCVSHLVVTPQAIGLRSRTPLRGLEIIEVENKGNCNEGLTLSVDKGIKDIVTLSKSSLSLPKGERGNLSAEISVSSAGLYKGNIEVWRGDVLMKSIPVEVVALSQQSSLMDVEMEIDPALKVVTIGDTVEGKVTLVNLGTNELENVEMALTISKVGGAPISTLTESVSVRDYIVMTRGMKSPQEAGDYNLNVAVKYGNTVTRASESFTVVEEKPEEKKPSIADYFSFAALGVAWLVNAITKPTSLIAAVLSLIFLIGIPAGAVYLTIRYLRGSSGAVAGAENAGLLKAAGEAIGVKRQTLADLWKKQKTVIVAKEESVAKLVKQWHQKGESPKEGTTTQLSKMWKEGKI